MKKTLLAFACILFATVLIVLSCKKTNNPSTTSGIKPSLNQLFSGLKSSPQNLSVTAGRDTIVYGTHGTMLHFYKNSFKDINGNLISSGTIYLQVVEMYKPGDMICNRASTMANGKILQSGGQITIIATRNGGAVVNANGYGIGFLHGNSSVAPMALFYGATGNADSVTTWTQSDTTKNGTKVQGTITVSDTTVDSVRGGGGGVSVNTRSYFFFDTCKSFNWANCDWFHHSDSALTSVSVILPDTSFNATNTQMYLVLHVLDPWSVPVDTSTAVISNFNSTVEGSASYVAATNTLNLISEGNTSIVPVGENYRLVVIANKGGTYYYYEQKGVIPHNGLKVSTPLSPDSQGDIIARLQGL